jgi:hypothetical protein
MIKPSITKRGQLGMCLRAGAVTLGSILKRGLAVRWLFKEELLLEPKATNNRIFKI